MPFQNILLIDDDDDDQEIFFTAANEISRNITCLGLVNAADALKRLSQKEITPDVIFLDLNMPVMNGQQFLVEIKKRPDLKSIPIIIFSTSSNRTTIQLMKDLGAYDFITKPEKYDALVNILKPLFT